VVVVGFVVVVVGFVVVVVGLALFFGAVVVVVDGAAEVVVSAGAVVLVVAAGPVVVVVAAAGAVVVVVAAAGAVVVVVAAAGAVVVVVAAAGTGTAVNALSKSVGGSFWWPHLARMSKPPHVGLSVGGEHSVRHEKDLLVEDSNWAASALYIPHLGGSLIDKDLEVPDKPELWPAGVGLFT
jgi:hypothetical protein